MSNSAPRCRPPTPHRLHQSGSRHANGCAAPPALSRTHGTFRDPESPGDRRPRPAATEPHGRTRQPHHLDLRRGPACPLRPPPACPPASQPDRHHAAPETSPARSAGRTPPSPAKPSPHRCRPPNAPHESRRWSPRQSLQLPTRREPPSSLGAAQKPRGYRPGHAVTPVTSPIRSTRPRPVKGLRSRAPDLAAFGVELRYHNLLQPGGHDRLRDLLVLDGALTAYDRLRADRAVLLGQVPPRQNERAGHRRPRRDNPLDVGAAARPHPRPHRCPRMGCCAHWSSSTRLFTSHHASSNS